MEPRPQFDDKDAIQRRCHNSELKEAAINKEVGGKLPANIKTVIKLKPKKKIKTKIKQQELPRKKQQELPNKTLPRPCGKPDADAISPKHKIGRAHV